MSELNAKLFKLRAEVGKISKDSENPFFHSKYFDVNKLIEQLQPLLEKYKLLLTQPINNNEVYSIITDIESGEEYSSYLKLPEQSDPQKIGSAITYYRRYTLASLLALQSEDDDGNNASGNNNNGTPKRNQQDEKPWLNKTKYQSDELTPEWQKVKSALEQGKAQPSDVRKKYKVAKDLYEELETIANTNGVTA